jgi:plasmid stability protein
LSTVQGPFSVAPCQNLSVTIRNFFSSLQVAVVVRARHGLSARDRVRALVFDLVDASREQEATSGGDAAEAGGEEEEQEAAKEAKVQRLMQQVCVIEGSLEDALLWQRTDLVELAPKLCTLIHCAGNVSFDSPLSHALRHNTGAYWLAGGDTLPALWPWASRSFGLREHGM